MRLRHCIYRALSGRGRETDGERAVDVEHHHFAGESPKSSSGQLRADLSHHQVGRARRLHEPQVQGEHQRIHAGIGG